MNLAMAFKMAIESVRGNKMRSFLTMLGIIIGVTAVITLVSIIQGATNSISDTVESLGTNTITVSISRVGSNRSVSTEELDTLVAENEDSIAAYIPSLSSYATLKYGNSNMTTNVAGTNTSYTYIKDMEIQMGRFITELDLSEHKRVAVIGEYNANELFGSIEAAMGEKIKINGELFTVIGIFARKGTGEEGSSDDTAVIPYTTATRIFKNNRLTSFTMQAKSSDTVDRAMLVIKQFLFTKFQDSDAYNVISMAEMLEEFDKMMAMMSGIIAGIAGISLVVAGIGIMNIMLVSVTERTREIGIRKAIGAKRRSILVQFLIEAIVLSLLGGALGIALGSGLAIWIGSLLDISARPAMGIVIGCLSYSIAVGVFFGLYPANKASKLNPIEALRFE